MSIFNYPPQNGVLTSLIWRKTATGGETSLSGYDNASQALSYTPGQEQVYLNGILLVRGDDYTATNGTSITGLAALAANDFVQINCYNNFSLATLPATSLTGTIANNQLQNSAITINGSAISLGGSVSSLATLTGSETLTNKTLTTPLLSAVGGDEGGEIHFAIPATNTTLSTRITVDSYQNRFRIFEGGGTGRGVFVDLANASAGAGSELITSNASQTLTNKTLTTPLLNQPIFISAEERVNVVASAATGTINIDALTASIWYYTSNASANHTLNFRGNSGSTLNSILNTGDSITLAWLNTNGSPAYYPNVIQIDGSNVTTRWQGGSAPSSGNANSTDAYTFTIIKIAATPTYLVLGSQTRFA